MTAIEFNIAGTDTGNPGFTNAVKAHALEKNPILLTCGIYGNVIRFLALITIQDDIFAEALDIIEASIRAAKKKWLAKWGPQMRRCGSRILHCS